MSNELMPILRASLIVSNKKTVFQTFDRKITIKVPGSLVQQLVEVCDGYHNIEEIIEFIKKDWDENTVRSLLDELIQREILIDARRLHEEIWKVVENPMSFPVNLTIEEVGELVKSASKRSRTNSCVSFFKPQLSSVGLILVQRKSARSFSDNPVSFQSVINMLWSAYGELASRQDGYVRKTSPSAGALYPILIHLTLFNKVGDIKPAVYCVRYNQDGEVGLEHVSDDILRFARSFLNPVDILDGIQGIIVISGSFLIAGEKYGNRSMLYVPIEAGHVAQNIMIEAIEHKVATLEIGGFVDKLLKEAIGLQSQYRPLTTIAFGNESTDSTSKSISPNLQIDWAIPMSEEYQPPFAVASARFSSKRNWSHGRDASPQKALVRAISEAKEWTACGCIPKLLNARISEIEPVIDPRDIVKFHPSQYRVKGFPFAQFDELKKYEWTKGYEFGSESEVYILADLVYFPYFPKTQYYTYANSSGCAAHPDEQIAIQTGTLELIERDSFMNSYLNRLIRPTVSEETFPEEIRDRIINLQALGFRVWVKDHSLDLAPVVMVFAQSDKNVFTTCASCSSFDIEYAVSHALMEVEASVLSRLQNGQPKFIRPQDVGEPLDHGRLYGQKKYYQHADFLVNSGELISFDKIGCNVAHSWNGLFNQFNQNGWQLIVIPLHLSNEYGGNDGLHIVRCIVPGMVPMTFGYQQEAAGMKRIYEITKEFGNEELSYRELTKFPHPFE